MTQLAAICSLVKEFHWTLEEVAELNWSQIEALNKGLGELNMFLEKSKPPEQRDWRELAHDEEYQKKLGASLALLKDKDGKISPEALFRFSKGS